jgi:formylglycine-generating enzyme required for sulfatase activity
MHFDMHVRVALIAGSLSAVFGGAFLGCASAAPARREVLVVVDTDAPTLDDVARDPELSLAASVDTVRVDVLDEHDAVTSFRELSATSRLDWPLSFSLVPPEEGEVHPVTLRIRGFRGRDAQATTEPTTEGVVPTLSPLPELSLDRVVQIGLPAPQQVVRLGVLLSVDCLGVPSSFADRVTCVDGAHLAQPFDAALPLADVKVASRAGSSTLARSVPCTHPPEAGRICIPGGLSVLGAAAIAGVEDGISTLSSLPMRLVRVAPFFMDETEFTVGRARPLLARLQSGPPLARGAAAVPDSQYCNLSDDPAADALPLNCVGDATAAELCALVGGALPTEAQWNHAATGRGQGRAFPWGETEPMCCSASTGRLVRSQPLLSVCPGEGAEPVGSHRGVDCGGIGDVSRDGVLDLGGSVREILADRAALLDDGCWGPRFGALVDPLCSMAAPRTPATRGGSWTSGPLNALVAIRGNAVISADRGLRCVYRDGAP